MSDAPNEFLPPSSIVNVPILARVFSEVTNSYKYLFFLSLLENIEKSAFSGAPISIHELVLDMLAIAWYPYSYFRLSFGKQDQVTKELDATTTTVVNANKLKPLDRAVVRRTLAECANTKQLSRYVPYRLIRPFFYPETRNLSDAQVNVEVAKLAAERFVSETPPPYKFDQLQTSIVIHPEWMNYFRQNMFILKGWSSWMWLKYMQKCNPNVPGLATKLFPPLVRDSLLEQTKFWKIVLDRSEVHCIYSKEKMSIDNLSLDHFVPWSFVVHDELWNLIPTSRNVNSKKGDRLPSIKYIDEFAIAQHQALSVARESYSKWADLLGTFHRDLGVKSEAELLDADVLKLKYKNVFLPLLSLASINGFEADWEY